MRRYAAGAGCLMEFLQQALDDPDPGPLRPVFGVHRHPARIRARVPSRRRCRRRHASSVASTW